MSSNCALDKSRPCGTAAARGHRAGAYSRADLDTIAEACGIRGHKKLTMDMLCVLIAQKIGVTVAEVKSVAQDLASSSAVASSALPPASPLQPRKMSVQETYPLFVQEVKESIQQSTVNALFFKEKIPSFAVFEKAWKRYTKSRNWAGGFDDVDFSEVVSIIDAQNPNLFTDLISNEEAYERFLSEVKTEAPQYSGIQYRQFEEAWEEYKQTGNWAGGFDDVDFSEVVSIIDAI